MTDPSGDSASRHQRLADWFDQVVALPVGERDAFMRAHVEDASLRAELQALLAADERAGDWFEKLAREVGRPPLPVINARYRVLSLEGHGGMGVVYRAHDTRLMRDVALKLLPESLTHDATSRARLVAEARAASGVRHPRLAVVHDVAETDDGRQFLVMEWCEGETLRARLQRGALPVIDATRIAHQLGEALAAAHACGIVHRDVKPSNVIIDADGNATLIDFGIAKLPGVELTRDGATPGTVAYMSPEQTHGRGVDAASDVWSVGVVLFEMLSGVRPFTGASDAHVIHAIRHDPPPPLVSPHAEIPAWLADVVMRCLRKDPDARFADASALDEALASGVSDNPLPVIPTTGAKPPVPTSWPITRRGARVLGVGAVLVVVLAAVLGPGVLRRETVTTGTAAAAAPMLTARVLVAPLENRTGDPQLNAVGSMAADWIIQGLSGTGLVDVVPVTTAMTVSRIAPDSSGSPLAAAGDFAPHVLLLARETGAGLVVAGAYYLEGDSVYLRAALYDASDGARVLAAIEPVAFLRTAPLRGVEQLRERVLSVLAPRLDPRLQGHVALLLAPPTYEAYRAFTRGIERFILSDFSGALPLLEEAAQRDTGFLSPRLFAAIARVNLGDMAGADSMVQELDARRDRLRGLETAGVEMLQAEIRGDHAARYQAHLAAPRIAHGTIAHWGLANAAKQLNRPREALRVLAELDPRRGELRGWTAYWTDLVESHAMLEDLQSARLAAQQARAVLPESREIEALMVQAMAAGGAYDSVQVVLDRQGAVGTFGARLAYNAAVQAAARGDQARARTWFGDALRRMPVAGQQPVEEALLVARTMAWLGRAADAESQLRVIDRAHPDLLEVRAILGLLALAQGDTVTAFRHDRWLAELSRPFLRGRHTAWRSRFAAQRGDADAAVRLLRQAHGEGEAEWAWLRVDPYLAPVRDAPAFREFLRPKG